MKAQSICIHCKQVIRKPRAAKSTNKHYAEDIAKANAAIATLERICTQQMDYRLAPSKHADRKLTDGLPTYSFSLAPASSHFLAACELELERMQRAVSDPELLWSIYRRKFAKSGPAYGLETAQPIIQTTYPNEFRTS